LVVDTHTQQHKLIYKKRVILIACEKMKKQAMVVCLFLVLTIFSMYPLGATAETLSQPTVTIPSNWYLTSNSVSYPNKVGVHDSTGSGLLQYFQNSELGGVSIYYEKTYSSYTSTELANEALNLYNSWSSAETNAPNPEQITPYNVGGWTAGCYRGTSSDRTTNYLVIVFVANGYYIDIYSTFPPSTDTANEAVDLIKSISVPISDVTVTPNYTYSPSPDYTYILELVIAAIIVVVIVVVIVVAVRKRKPKKEPEQQAAIRLEPVLIH
jgi:hypothetical protein